jgi:hypothetical protein
MISEKSGFVWLIPLWYNEDPENAVQCTSIQGPSVYRNHCAANGATTMTETPNDDRPGFVAGEPVHCFTCFRLIRPGQAYYLTIEDEVLCADCALDEGVIRVREDLAVEVRRDRLLVQRGKAEVEVFAGEIRHLVNALVEGAARSQALLSRDHARIPSSVKVSLTACP